MNVNQKVEVVNGYYEGSQGTITNVDGFEVTVKLEEHGDEVEFFDDDLVVINK